MYMMCDTRAGKWDVDLEKVTYKNVGLRTGRHFADQY